MNSSNQHPALPTWIFIATDIATLGIAAGIALWAPHPLSVETIIWIVALVGIGAIFGLLPLVLRYERQKNEILDERQRELEALARIVSGSAEQISIATKSLHDTAELAQKNFRLADQLPHKLQDKIAEFQSQLSATADTEKEELERELLALRTTESERLESVSQRIAKSSAEWAKLEAATHQHLTAANEAVAKLAFGTAGAIGKAQVAAEQALAQARVEAARALGEASGRATRAIESAKTSALADLDARLAVATSALIERVAAGVSAKLAGSLPPAAESSATPPTTASPTPAETSSPTNPPAAAPSVAQPPKRPRKMRREDPAPGGTAEEHPNLPPESPPGADKPVKTMPDTSPPIEPLPIPAHTIPEITPVAPSTAEPFSGHIGSVPNGTAAPASTESSGDAPPPGEPARLPRKRAPKKPAGDDDPALGLELDDTTSGFTPGTTERVISSDGATRLLVTAYIGIGNRLFIRGNGPGLSWEKGVPLQFVSIGKWRWETNDANTAVQFKLYKNDDLECSALGALSLDPGHQQEVTAAF